MPGVKAGFHPDKERQRQGKMERETHKRQTSGQTDTLKIGGCAERGTREGEEEEGEEGEGGGEEGEEGEGRAEMRPRRRPRRLGRRWQRKAHWKEKEGRFRKPGVGWGVGGGSPGQRPSPARVRPVLPVASAEPWLMV